ncbi:MAG: M23 family metallopeptidase, partial [Arthrobacter sp.]
MCAVSTLTVFAFGVEVPPAAPPKNASAVAGPAASVAPPAAVPLVPPARGPSTVVPANIAADVRAIVSFNHTEVRTKSKDGKHELNVASEELRRPAAGFLMAPLETLIETSPFGLRISPITGTAGEFHWGQDFAAACGTRVYAVDAGVVRAVGWHPWGGGNRVEIDHGNGLITTYNHLEGIAVKKGDSVQVGEVIAKVGTTGSSTGCHLHFETILNGAHVNPLDWTFLPT